MNRHDPVTFPPDSAIYRWRYQNLVDCLPGGWEPLRLAEGGLLCRSTRLGTLACWQGLSMVAVNQVAADRQIERENTA